MMSRANQNWPDDMTVNVDTVEEQPPAYAVGQTVRSVITGEIGIVTRVYRPRGANFDRVQAKKRNDHQAYHVDFPVVDDEWQIQRCTHPVRAIYGDCACNK